MQKIFNVYYFRGPEKMLRNLNDLLHNSSFPLLPRRSQYIRKSGIKVRFKKIMKYTTGLI